MRENYEVVKRNLGNTEIKVTPIGLGVMQFSGGEGVFGMAFPNLSQLEMDVIISTALEGGINWFDTAEMYGFGRSERGLANALKNAGKDNDHVVVATKWFPLFRTARNIAKTIENRIKFLDGYTIDLYMVHQPWGLSSTEAEMDAMADLVEAGKIRSVGVSNYDAKKMERAYNALEKRGIPLAVNQVHYSLLHRKIESNGILEAAKELGVTIIAYTPLASGILSGKYHRDNGGIYQKSFFMRKRLERDINLSNPVVKSLQDMASKYESTPAQVALNWLINFSGETVVAIPGATEVNQAQQSAGAMDFRLTDEDMKILDELTLEFK
jgi:aryl-alcohol dehydrogenase-like predicted oxidoreductase